MKPKPFVLSFYNRSITKSGGKLRRGVFHEVEKFRDQTVQGSQHTVKYFIIGRIRPASLSGPERGDPRITRRSIIERGSAVSGLRDTRKRGRPHHEYGHMEEGGGGNKRH